MNTKQSYRLGQSQAIAPQLQQGLTLLATPLLELQAVLRAELQNNPMLEEMPPAEVTAMLDVEANGPAFPDYADPSEPIGVNVLGGESFKMDDNLADFLFDNITRDISLQEHLMLQADAIDTTKELHAAMYELIGNIDENGYLQDYVPMVTKPMIARAFDLIRTFTPRGVGATDLQDCLRLQLDDTSTEANAIVTSYWDDLLNKRWHVIKNKLDMTQAQLDSALSQIALCTPYPGRAFDSSPVIEAIPEVFVDEDFNVTLNDRDTPRLKTNAVYKAMLLSPNTPPDAKAWLKEKAIAAKHLQHNLANRGSTIFRVANYIISRQLDYFTKGATALTPMTMAEVAEALGYHETTISRAVNGKYMMTPKGLLPFRFFFTAGTSWENPDISNAAFKERVRKMIAEEPANNRLNDDDIVKELRKYGVTIARRTVAKYRLELNILPYHLRGK